uniref:Uncharacterized protein n=1 Tax=Tetranychus urticae TaxID=32264 RepID=T1K6W7_TETUR
MFLFNRGCWLICCEAGWVLIYHLNLDSWHAVVRGYRIQSKA